jgi:hypothetical protein
MAVRRLLRISHLLFVCIEMTGAPMSIGALSQPARAGPAMRARLSFGGCGRTCYFRSLECALARMNFGAKSVDIRVFSR